MMLMVDSSSRKAMDNNHRTMADNNTTRLHTTKINTPSHRWVEMTMEVRMNLAVCAVAGMY